MIITRKKDVPNQPIIAAVKNPRALGAASQKTYAQA
jgi:hypothetical protein